MKAATAANFAASLTNLLGEEYQARLTADFGFKAVSSPRTLTLDIIFPETNEAPEIFAAQLQVNFSAEGESLFALRLPSSSVKLTGGADLLAGAPEAREAAKLLPFVNLEELKSFITFYL